MHAAHRLPGREPAVAQASFCIRCLARRVLTVFRAFSRVNVDAHCPTVSQGKSATGQASV